MASGKACLNFMLDRLSGPADIARRAMMGEYILYYPLNGPGGQAMPHSNLYPMIFKRKSFHLFRNVGPATIAPETLDAIRDAYDSFDRLCPEIRTAIRIVPASRVSFSRGAEYCILLYSEKKPNDLMNLGYIGEQLDLYLVSRDIGTLWFGIARPDVEAVDGMDYVIMIAIHRIDDAAKFRKDMVRSKRKPLDGIWAGEPLAGVADIARFAPSACNSQPWFVKNSGEALEVFRYRKPGRVGIMPAAAVAHYNRIDIGIFLCFLELCLAHEGLGYSRALFVDSAGDEVEYSKVAEYAYSRNAGAKR